MSDSTAAWSQWQNLSRVLRRAPSKLFFVRDEQEAWDEIEKERSALQQIAAAH